MNTVYTIVETFTTYSKKKGAHDKTATLATRLTEAEKDAFVKENCATLIFEQDTDHKNWMVARKRGLLFPGRVTIKAIKIKS